MLLFCVIKKLPYVIRYDTNTYKIQNDVLKASIRKQNLRSFKINEEVHSIIVNFDFALVRLSEWEMNCNDMWIEFQNESDELICRLYKSAYKKRNDYILQLYAPMVASAGETDRDLAPPQFRRNYGAYNIIEF
jgi:hypothetical protein